MEYEDHPAGYAPCHGKIHTTFDTYWHSDEFQDFSEKDRPYLEDAIDAERGRGKKEGSALSYAFRIRPYPYQEQILDALQAERQIHHRTRNLVVAATGTGKTAIAAFDYARFAKNRNKETRLLLWPTGRKSSPNPFPPFVKSSKIQALGNFP